MEYLTLSLVLAAVFAYIAYPILQPPREEASEPDTREALLAEREAAYQAIRDLDFDFQLGKLSQVDYETLREKHKAHAAAVLQQIDALGAPPPARAAPASEVSLRCGNCGTPYEPDDKFCRKCGNKLK